MRLDISKFQFRKLSRLGLLLVSTLLIVFAVIVVAAGKPGKAEDPPPPKKARQYRLKWPSPDERVPSYTLFPKEGTISVYRAPQDNDKLGPLQEMEVFETEHHLYKAPFHYKNVTMDYWQEYSEKGVEIFADVGSISIVEEKPIVSVTVVGTGCSAPGYNIVEWWGDGEDISNTRGQLIKRQRIDNLNGQHNAWIQKAFTEKQEFESVEEAREFIVQIQKHIYAMTNGYYVPGSIMSGLYENTAYFRIGEAGAEAHKIVIRAGSLDYEDPGVDRERYPADYAVRLIDVVVKK